MYKDKDKQRQVQREWVRQKRMERKGSTSVIDAVGAAHSIDYEGRRKTYAVLKAWAEGKGTAKQGVMGALAMTYHYLKVKANQYTMDSYLGHA